MKTALVVSTPFLEELRERAVLAAQNDEAQMEAIYLQKAADEIERQQALIARLLKTMTRRQWRGHHSASSGCAPPAGKANDINLYRSLIEVQHGDHEYTLETHFAAKNDRQALVYANRHAKELFAGARRENGRWFTPGGDVAWELMSAVKVPALQVRGADGKVYVFSTVCQPVAEARHAS